MRKSAYLLVFPFLLFACNKEENIITEDDNNLNYSGGQIEFIVQSGKNYSINWTYVYNTQGNLSSIETYHQSTTRKFYINTENGLINQYYVSSNGVQTIDYTFTNNILTSQVLSNKTGGRDIWANTEYTSSVNANNELVIEGTYNSVDNINATSSSEILEEIRFNNSTKSHISGGGISNVTYDTLQSVFKKIKLIGNVHKQFPIKSFSDFNIIKYDGVSSSGYTYSCAINYEYDLDGACTKITWVTNNVQITDSWLIVAYGSEESAIEALSETTIYDIQYQ